MWFSVFIQYILYVIPRSKLLNYVRAFSEHFPFSELLHLSTNRFSCNVVSQPRFDSTTSVFYRLIESWYLLESSHFLKLRQSFLRFGTFYAPYFLATRISTYFSGTFVDAKLRSLFQDISSKALGSLASYHLSLWNLLPATFSLP